MKKAYISPELKEMWLTNEDVVLASPLGLKFLGSNGDWGYGDDFKD